MIGETSPHPGLHLRTTWPEPRTARITARGELDAATAPTFAELVTTRLRSAPARLILDLSKVDFIGTAGLSVLAGARLRAEHTGTELVLVPGETVRRALEATGMELPLSPAEVPPSVNRA
jgi:anti-anti-sigma factor